MTLLHQGNMVAYFKVTFSYCWHGEQCMQEEESNQHGHSWQSESREICRHRQCAQTDPLSLMTEGSQGNGHFTVILKSKL